MDTNNPAEMSNDDLEKDMQLKNLEAPKGNQEKVNKSSAAEGTLKTPETDESSITNVNTVSKGGEEEDSQDGSIPDPEEVGNWENNDDDLDKVSG